MKHYRSEEFCQFLQRQASLHKRKVPLLKTFWRRFWCKYCLQNPWVQLHCFIYLYQ